MMGKERACPMDALIKNAKEGDQNCRPISHASCFYFPASYNNDFYCALYTCVRFIKKVNNV